MSRLRTLDERETHKKAPADGVSETIWNVPSTVTGAVRLREKPPSG
jgi:hypothetical protein